MKKKLLTLSIVTGLGLSIIGCSYHKDVKADIPKQFEKLSSERIDKNSDVGSLMIVKHKETGKRFIIYYDYRAGGICPLD